MNLQLSSGQPQFLKGKEEHNRIFEQGGENVSRTDKQIRLVFIKSTTKPDNNDYLTRGINYGEIFNC